MKLFDTTVQELIDVLQTLDPEANIYIGSDVDLNGVEITTDPADDDVNLLLPCNRS